MSGAGEGSKVPLVGRNLGRCSPCGLLEEGAAAASAQGGISGDLVLVMLCWVGLRDGGGSLSYYIIHVI